MKRVLISALMLVVLPVLAGCSGNFYSIFRTTPNGTGKAHSQLVVTDAKQGISLMQVGKDKDGNEILKACAARSPDVFTALSQAFNGSANADLIGKFTGALSGAGSSAESASAFGLRTQLTQTQGELLYELCFASLNGTLTPDKFATEMHRYQNTLVTMLAIEQLTGFARPTVVAIGGQASAGAADALAKQQDLVTVAKTNEKTLQGKAEEAQKASDALNGPTKTAQENYQAAVDAKKADADIEKLRIIKEKAEGEQRDAQKKADAAAKAAKDQTAYRESQEKILNKMMADVDVSAGSITAVVKGPEGKLSNVDEKTAAYISDAVVKLQSTHLNQTFVADECLSLMFHPDQNTALSEKEKGELFGVCKTHLEEIDKYRTALLYRFYGCDRNGDHCTISAKDLIGKAEPGGDTSVPVFTSPPASPSAR